jgi:hypothetical protein
LNNLPTARRTLARWGVRLLLPLAVATALNLGAVAYLTHQGEKVDVRSAQRDADARSRVSGLSCWAEVNTAQPGNYEVLCR